MLEIKEVKYSTETASSDSKSEDLHDDPIYIVRTPNKIYDSSKERTEIFPLNQVIQIILVHPNRMSKYKTDIKDKYQFDLFDWFCSEKGKKKINLMNEKL